MTETLIRDFSGVELEIRSAAKGGDGRIIEGIAVPYNVLQRIDATLVERFVAGAFDHQIRAAHRVRFQRDHNPDRLLGVAVELRDDPVGLVGAFRVAKGPNGDEVLDLVEMGALTDLSVGFRERQNRREPDGSITRVTADLREVSIVREGAYGAAAAVTGVREARSALAEAEQIIANLPSLSLGALIG
jgi:HK97 family phage prohead protease